MKRIRGVELAVLIFCLGLSMSFPISTTRMASTPQETNDAAGLNTKGLELFRSGKFAEAVEAYQQAIKLKRDYPEAHYNLGDTYFQLALYKKAIEAYKQAVRYRPNFTAAHNNMGTAYSKSGEHKNAIEAYKEAIRLNPKGTATYYNLAATYAERGNQKAALEQLKILRGLDPQLADKLSILIYKPMATVFDGAATRLTVIATDSNSLPVKDLNQEDIQVFEDGVAQTISSFSKQQIPLIYGLTVDNSGTMRPVIELVIGTCKGIIQTNERNDETLLVRFISTDKIETVQDFTSDQLLLNKGVENLFIEGGQSAIVDAVYLSAQRVSQYRFADGPIRRAIILVTDGDERSSYYTNEQLLKLLRQVDVQLFAISLGKADKKGATLNGNQTQRSVELLTKLAGETGGKAFFPKSVAELQTVTDQMANLIRSEYVIGYEPASSVAPGTYRRVTVNIAPKPGREKWTALTRAGYIAPEKELH